MGGAAGRPHPRGMDITTAPTPPDSPSSANRTGATWVAGTGAFLLLAATALFVAVRWDDIPGAAKLGIVGALTGAFLLGGRALARTLPATGDVIFHLGALLIPVDVAAVAVRLQLGWRGLLLTEGLAAGGALAALAAGTGSVVLTWTAALGAVVTAAGVAAVSPAPAPLLLALAAAAVSLMPSRSSRAADAGAMTSGAARLARLWAALAGLAPVLGVTAVAALRSRGHVGVGVLTELGLAGAGAAWAALASGIIAAAVIGRQARTRGDNALAGLAVAVLVAAVITPAVGTTRPWYSDELALPGLLVAVEAATLLARRDEFWGRIAPRAALLAEIPGAVIAGPVALVAFAASPIINNFEFFGTRAHGDAVAGAGLGLLAVAGFLRGARSADAAEAPGLLAAVRAAAGRFAWLVAPAAIAAVAFGTANGPATAATTVALAALLATAPRRSAWLTAGFLALWAPLTTVAGPWAVTAAGLAGAAAATLAARHAHRRPALAAGRPADPGAAAPADRLHRSTGTAERAAGGRAGSATGRPPAQAEIPLLRWLSRHFGGAGDVGAEAVVLTLAAVGAAALGWLAGPVGDGAIVSSVLAVASGFAVAAALEPAPVLPMLARLGGLSVALAMTSADPHRALPALLVATGLAVADAIGRNQPVIGFGAAATGQFVVADVARRGGLDPAGTGLALCVAAVVWAGLALLTDERWHPPLFAASAVGLVIGVALASQDPRAGANALLITGGLVAAAGLVTRRPAVVGAGAVIASLAVGSHLETSHVRATDAYLAPVAALLLGAGFQQRRTAAAADRPSSWVAYTPAVVLLGGAALVERIGGGGGVHALVAGAVGIGAVVAGGGRRLAGPLVAGTALLVAVTVHESLATLATVPTWGWLAAGGALLLAVGVTLERRGGTSPAETGRRLVDVVAERFS